MKDLILFFYNLGIELKISILNTTIEQCIRSFSQFNNIRKLNKNCQLENKNEIIICK